jgi:uncharacterized protein YndB with AHSA1/START domain
MRINYESEHDTAGASAKAATGRTYEDWFRLLDAAGGATAGRKALGDLLLKKHNLDAWWAITLIVEYEKTRGAFDKDGAPRGYNICVTKSFSAPPARAFEELAKGAWWLGPKATATLAEGAAFDDGDGHTGTFKKVVPGKSIKFTWQGAGHQLGETVEIKLTPSGAKTAVALTHDRLPDRAAADGMRAAWAAFLEAWKLRLS